VKTALISARINYGWAIQVQAESGHVTCLGIGWFPELPERWTRCAGHNIMVWPTRVEARQALALKRRDACFVKRARVQKVCVTVGPA